jgi:cytochrome c oxidase subunit 1
VAAVFFGRSIAGEAMEPWQEVAEIAGAAGAEEEEEEHLSGTLVLVGVFLLSFAVYYFANWKWLADVWQVR